MNELILSTRINSKLNEGNWRAGNGSLGAGLTAFIPATGSGDAPPARCVGSRAQRWGFEGGRSIPLPDRNVQHCVGWLRHLSVRGESGCGAKPS